MTDWHKIDEQWLVTEEVAMALGISSDYVCKLAVKHPLAATKKAWSKGATSGRGNGWLWLKGDIDEIQHIHSLGISAPNAFRLFHTLRSRNLKLELKAA